MSKHRFNQSICSLQTVKSEKNDELKKIRIRKTKFVDGKIKDVIDKVCGVMQNLGRQGILIEL